MDRFVRLRARRVEFGAQSLKMVVLEGAQVCICGRRQEAVGQAVAELAGHAAGKVEGKAADVRDSDQVAELFRFIESRFGGLDVPDLLVQQRWGRHL